jgi:hypothetical protein
MTTSTTGTRTTTIAGRAATIRITAVRVVAATIAAATARTTEVGLIRPFPAASARFLHSGAA